MAAVPDGAAVQAASRGRPEPRRRGAQRRGLRRWAWLFSLPALAAFLVFAWYPTLMAFVVAFQSYKVVGPVHWVGWANFARALHDPVVPVALRNSFYYVLLTICLTFWVPIIVSILLMEMGERTRRTMMILWFIPMPAVAGTVIWKYLYDPNYGPLAVLFHRLGLPNFGWLNNPHWAMFLIVLPSLVMYGPGLIYISTLQAVSQELYEAAELDGASFLRKVWAITLPTLRPIISILLLLSVIGGLQVFTQPYIMTNGGPIFATLTMVLYIYRSAFHYLEFGYADVLAILLFLILAVFVVISRRLERGRES